MPTNQLKSLILAALDDSKARDIAMLDVRKLTDVTDYMVICSGTSNRHTRSIANNLVVQAKAKGIIPLAVEGRETGEWILVDLTDAVVHIMLPQTREFYSLEKLWSVAKELKARTAKPKKIATKKATAKKTALPKKTKATTKAKAITTTRRKAPAKQRNI